MITIKEAEKLLDIVEGAVNISEGTKRVIIKHWQNKELVEKCLKEEIMERISYIETFSHKSSEGYKLAILVKKYLKEHGDE
jgi:hypothetical protein